MKDLTKFIGSVIFLGILLIVPISCNAILGVYGFGPKNTLDVTINRTYVDYSGSGDNKSSHYMVATDKGVFEVDNGIMLGMWNADEVYGKFKNDKKYRITTKGNRVVGMFFQEYPYILNAYEIQDGIEK